MIDKGERSKEFVKSQERKTRSARTHQAFFLCSELGTGHAVGHGQHWPQARPQGLALHEVHGWLGTVAVLPLGM